MDDSSAGPIGQQMQKVSSRNVASESQIGLVCDLVDIHREAFDEIQAKVSATDQPEPSPELLELLVETAVLTRRIAKHVNVDLRNKLGQKWHGQSPREIARSLLQNAA